MNKTIDPAARSPAEGILSLSRNLIAPLRPSDSRIRYRLIDILRGLASFSVIIWHYQQFYWPCGVQSLPIQRDLQPLYVFLAPFYEYGVAAVQLFWMISGFVFSATYWGTKPSTRAFFVARFARLYPLHFATLISVALLQAWSWSVAGCFQVYQNNDAYHFFLQTLFISNWGFETGPSFNGPIWSVSVEVFIYFIFFLVCPFVFRWGVLAPAALAAGFACLTYFVGVHVFWWCGMFFFTGAAAYAALKTVPKTSVTLAGAGAGLATLVIMADETLFPREAYVLLLTTALVLCLAYLDERQAARWQGLDRLRWIGDSTYATYLLHVPIQIALLNLIDMLRIDRELVIQEPLFLIGYVGAVIVAAGPTYLYFERPANLWLRSRLGGRTPAPEPQRA